MLTAMVLQGCVVYTPYRPYHHHYPYYHGGW
jgi:hypothetical protein